MTTDVSIPLAFMGGLLSFVSPCVLPLVPSYISFVTGISFEELTSVEGDKSLKKVILFNSLMFILGFSTVFVVILGSSAQLFGSLFMEYQDVIRKIGGLVIILLGVHIIGIINFNILQRDKRLHFFREKPTGLLGSFLVGIGFAAGWTPCIGPILSAIFAVAATSESPWSGMLLFIAYSVGLAIPFLLTSLGINTFLKHFNRLKKHMRVVSVVTGIFLVATGLLIFTNSLGIIAVYLNSLIPSLS
ncbi:MAG TPA: cytochrome C biogenesis protein [Deltaproteobacteria bacterium]|nr:MAG: cytochrome C biogenesis protein [Deltaproteobacteria bacterium GWA2_55_82]OGQ63304.1 MAG: cytochrome C biogenesis protein [Deltaproteobacteria bacterium RIFCSPLOWO2_02_FULL_55_12]OIJ73140.1 MAG: cytochrome C biogenesis protein [Deltaproteobacteria bacterium GWC2_55_46]HBG45607.1 cytochrome C biogenesis protein [Deltaproteobacteria bacterium]HCY10438.1 cytochrome C biogenesis protein [Deltaproteobacteria bacterium]